MDLIVFQVHKQTLKYFRFDNGPENVTGSKMDVKHFGVQM